MAKEIKQRGQALAAQAQDQASAVAEQARAQALEALGAQEPHFWSNLGWLLLGAGVGALSAYLLDPDRGRRRQALVRDQLVHASKVVQQEVPKQVRHAQNRLQGLQHNLPLTFDSGASTGDDEASSPDWERAHNDDGSLTTPTT